MIDNREPNYICLDSRAVKLAQRLSDPDRLSFFDKFYAAYTEKLSGNEISCFPNDLVGDLLKMAAETMIDGFDTYMKRANANPTGRKPNDNPMGGQWVGSGTQSNQDQSKKEKMNQDQIYQIKCQLEAEGYSLPEIERALTKAEGRPGIRDLAAYIRKTIQGERQERRNNQAHNFSERDYSREDEKAFQRIVDQINAEKEQSNK